MAISYYKVRHVPSGQMREIKVNCTYKMQMAMEMRHERKAIVIDLETGAQSQHLLLGDMNERLAAIFHARHLMQLHNEPLNQFSA